MIHVRNGRTGGHPQTKGAGATWCGKKLLGQPEHNDDGLDTFTSYGSQVHVTLDPGAGTCEHCRSAFDADYGAAFPEGPKPIATFHTDSPEDMARAREVLSPAALTQHFGPGGGGMSSFEAVLRNSAGKGAA